MILEEREELLLTRELDRVTEELGLELTDAEEDTLDVLEDDGVVRDETLLLPPAAQSLAIGAQSRSVTVSVASESAGSVDPNES